MAIKYSTAARNAKMDALTTQIGTSALLKIYAGTRPTNPGTAIVAQTLLATLTCSGSAFAAASSAGVLTANSITSATAAGTGTASFYRLTTSGGTAVVDGDVSTSAADLNLNSVSITSGQSVSVTSFTLTENNG